MAKRTVKNESVPEFPVGPSFWKFSLILFGFLFLTFLDVWLGFTTFYFRDFAPFGYPIAAFAKSSLSAGELPFWNPYNQFGLPFMAQWNSQVFYPPALLSYLFPISWSLGVLGLVHLWIGGLGMFRLMERWTGNTWAAAIAGMAFSWNGLTWNALQWPNNLAAIAWAPWVFWACLSLGKSSRGIFPLWLVGSLQMLSGGPEMIILTWVIACVLVAIESFSSASHRWHILPRFFISTLLIAGFCAFQLLPFFQLLGLSGRGMAMPSTWAIPSWGWVNLILPLFRTYPSFQGVYLQPQQFWTTSYFPGVTIVALAFLGWWKLPRARRWTLGLLSLVFLWLALGDAGGLYAGLRTVLPQLEFMRFPVKYMAGILFLTPIFAGWGYVALQNATPKIRTKWMTGLGVTLASCILGVAAFSFTNPGFKESPIVTAENAVHRLFFLGGGLGLLGLHLLQRRRWAWPVLLAVLWLDIFLHAPDLQPRVDRDLYAPGINHNFMVNSPALGQGNVLVTKEAWDQVRFSSIPSPEKDFLWRRSALFGNLNLVDGIPKVNGFWSLFPKENDQFLSLYYLFDSPVPWAMEFAGVTHTNAQGNATNWVAAQPSHPLIYSGGKPEFQDPPENWRTLTNASFNFKDRIILPTSSQVLLNGKMFGPSKVSDYEISPHRWSMNVEAAQSTIVVCALTWYPCWKATVDGRPLPVLKAFNNFVAVAVPPGKHRLELRYIDSWFRWGCLVSLVSLGVVIWLSFFRKTA